MDNIQHLHRAIDLLGSQKALADAIGEDQRLVWAWINRGSLPEDYCPSIELATAGEVVCEDLRPDISWVRVKDKSWPHPKGRPLVDFFTKKAA